MYELDIYTYFFLLLLLLACGVLWNAEKVLGIENFWNMSTRWTRNQSYDLRGDPYPPIRFNPWLSPWGMSSWGYPFMF